MRPQNDHDPLEPIDNGAELLPSVAETEKEIVDIHSLPSRHAELQHYSGFSILAPAFSGFVEDFVIHRRTLSVSL